MPLHFCQLPHLGDCLESQNKTAGAIHSLSRILLHSAYGGFAHRRAFRQSKNFLIAKLS